MALGKRIPRPALHPNLAACRHNLGIEKVRKIPWRLNFCPLDCVSTVKDVVRDNVVNDETRGVVDLAYPNGKSWRTRHSHAWKPTSPDFFAVLGTPNGQGVGWMLAQHMGEMEGRQRKITKIEAQGSDSMELKLKIHLERD